ncbi:GNAT family N-acetyltransferase [Alteribacter aurantiacus]|uniref:GNAT family N-acetyltransferase n=1 Tax=Alteribacter aurantiacus TaxID=254410 RepID=UPI00040073AD|nr:GNAT family N-acetyltransferase [Alteribacter aurantiacus]
MTTIRPYRKTDKDFILELAARFGEFDHVGWRDPKEMSEAQYRLSLESIRDNKERIFIAENDRGHLSGYLEVDVHTDLFTQKKQAYLAAIAVARGGEGTGVGKKLIETAEVWAVEQGFEELVLGAFHGNERAIHFYKRLGFEIDTVTMVKKL